MSVSGYFKKSLGLETWGWLESLQKASQLRSISSIGPGTGDSALKAVRYIGEKLPRASPTWSEDIGVERCTSETFNNSGKATNSFKIGSQSQTGQFFSWQKQNPATVAKT